MDRYSFDVENSHLLLHAGLARRSQTSVPPSTVARAVAHAGAANSTPGSESFTPPTLKGTAAAAGTLSFLRSGQSVPIASGTLLEQAEAAGLTPEFGCRMGICHACTSRKAAGAVENLRTGRVSDEEDEDIQLCVSVPAGDVALEI